MCAIPFQYIQSRLSMYPYRFVILWEELNAKCYMPYWVIAIRDRCKVVFFYFDKWSDAALCLIRRMMMMMIAWIYYGKCILKWRLFAQRYRQYANVLASWASTTFLENRTEMNCTISLVRIIFFTQSRKYPGHFEDTKFREISHLPFQNKKKL